jgi:hypothetical protein
VNRPTSPYFALVIQSKQDTEIAALISLHVLHKTNSYTKLRHNSSPSLLSSSNRFTFRKAVVNTSIYICRMSSS